MKVIRVKDASRTMAAGESFKAGDLSGLAWQGDSTLYPIARRIDSMPEDEKESLLKAIKGNQEAPGEGLRYLVSSYGVPIVWVTHNGRLHRTRCRHSNATAKHIEIAMLGLQTLLESLTHQERLHSASS